MTTPEFLVLVAAALFLGEAAIPRVPVNLGWLGAMTLAVAVFLQWHG